MRSRQESEELIESSYQRVAFRPVAEMPFPDHPGYISFSFHVVADRFLTDGKPEVHGGDTRRTGIVLMSEPLLISSGHESGARGAADRAGYISARAADSVIRDRVYVRGRYILGSLASKVAVCQIVGQDDDHVRLPRPRRQQIGNRHCRGRRPCACQYDELSSTQLLVLHIPTLPGIPVCHTKGFPPFLDTPTLLVSPYLAGPSAASDSSRGLPRGRSRNR